MSAAAGPPGVTHCRRCGGALEHRAHGDRWRQVCTVCRAIAFHNPAVGVAVVLRDPAGRVLLGRRNSSYAGRWCIPCGYVEWDEDVRAAAEREFLEETGVTVETGAVLAVHSNFHNPAQHTVGIWFAGRRLGGELRAGDDLDAVAWFAPGDRAVDLAFPTDRLVLDQLADQTGRSRARPSA